MILSLIKHFNYKHIKLVMSMPIDYNRPEHIILITVLYAISIPFITYLESCE